MVHKNLELIIKKHSENKLSHAFLIETNDINRCYKQLLEVIKNILCPNSFSENCDLDCNICNLINLNSLPSVITISPDGASIKKEQIIDLKERMLSKPIYSYYNFYIINNAEKLTLSSANTMLKFLEEPNGQVIGFFITDNKENIISTIKSRCQIIGVIYDKNDTYEEINLNEEDFDKYDNLLIEYLKILESDSEMCLISNKKLVIEKLDGRIEFECFLKMMLKVYENILNKKLNLDYNISQLQKYSFINDKNNINVVIKKMKVIEKVLGKLAFNPNLELTLDCLVIEMGSIS